MEGEDGDRRVCGRSCPPVPYRIAKALHPGLYRNVELDIVQEERRETRLRTLDACKGFSPGDKCQVVQADNETHPYNAHIQFIDEQKGMVVAFIEELGVKKSLPVSAIRPLPLHQSSQADDFQSSLPVAELDLLPYLKKGKRRKHQQLLSLLTSDSKNIPTASFYRDRSYPNSSSSYHNDLSGSSSYNNDLSISSYRSDLSSSSYRSDLCGSSDDSTNISSIASTTCLSNQLISHSSIINNCYINNSSSDISSSVILSPVPERYLNPSGEIDFSSSITSPLIDFCFTSNTLEPLLVPTVSYTALSCAPGQCEPCQLVTTISANSSQPYCTMSTAPNQGPVYWMPVVAVPYTSSNMGQLSMGWNPTQDPYGTDLPVSDVIALHSFFNLGLEFYRMSTSAGQSVTYPAGLMYSPHSGSEMNQSMAVVMDSSSTYTNMAPVVCTEIHTNSTSASTHDGNTYNQGGSDCVKINHKMGTTFSISQPESCEAVCDSSKTHQVQRNRACDSYECGKNSKSSDPRVECNNTTKEIEDSEEIKDVCTGKDSNKDLKTDDDDDVNESMDARSDGDSGCPSECADLSPVCGPGSSEILQSEVGETSEQNNSVDNPKPRGRRRYYMYGNHKLVKPIKEIPVRFQILLAETSAAKARCEGQPIYMQQPQQTMYDYMCYQANESTQPQLNANATCFVPSQDSCSDANMAPTYISECYTVGPMSGYPNNVPSHITSHSTNPSSLHPVPMFAPPMPPVCVPSHTATSQNCQTIIVYSSHSSSSSASHSSSLPSQKIRAVSMPPLQYPPPTTLPPPSLDQMSTNSTPCLSPAVSQVTRTLPAKPNQSSILYNDQHMKVQTLHSQVVPSKQSVVLSVPPPSHTSTIQGPPSYHSSSTASHLTSNSMTPPHTPCRYPYSNPVYLPVTQPLAPSLNMHASNINGSSIHTPLPPQQGSSNSPIAGTPYPVPYPGVSANQYMYIYPSPPTGQSAAPSHVVYMVNPAYPPTQNYQQQGVLVPSSCPVPVQ